MRGKAEVEEISKIMRKGVNIIITDDKNKIEFSTARHAVSNKPSGILQDIWDFKEEINEKRV